MPARTTRSPAQGVREALTYFERHASKRDRDGMARYGIVAPKVFGMKVSAIRQLGKKLGRDHQLALALWETGWYEARMLCAFVDEPERVTPAQMDRWCRDFDNWAICDTLCFALWDRTPHAWAMVRKWANRKPEFERRAAFALIASLAAHDKAGGDAPFLKCLPLIERAATDERNFVKKGVSWALRGLGHRSAALHSAATSLARKLAASDQAAARWVGKDALRDLGRPLVAKKLAKERKPK